MRNQVLTYNSLMSESRGRVDKAAIAGLNGGGMWGSTPGFTLSPSEGAYIADIFNDAGKEKWDAMWVDGIHINGERYVVFREDERKTIHGRKGKSGVIISKCKQCFVVYHYPEGEGQANLQIAIPVADWFTGYMIDQDY